MIVDWTDIAQDNLHSLHSYIAEDNPDAADRMVARVLDAVASLAAFPNVGRPGRVGGTRELVIPRTPFIVAYRVQPSAIQILAVIHGRQQWPTAF
ncbi:MAG TPA: type II toxin-antitoxin system RelE/ParE family toxin [Silvibacterium sp.]|nr:type II toxin-antitoxin system RelE/ParE family toxin [Silvibacterium sp.]